MFIWQSDMKKIASLTAWGILKASILRIKMVMLFLKRSRCLMKSLLTKSMMLWRFRKTRILDVGLQLIKFLIISRIRVMIS